MTLNELIKELEEDIALAQEHEAKEGFPYANVHLDILAQLLEQLHRLKGLEK